MRTIEEVVKDIKSGEWAYDEAYSSGYDKLCGLLDEILEISKANESVNGDLISRSLLIEKLDADFAEGLIDCFDDIVGIVENQPTAYNDGWIPCSERLPEEQKCKDGHIDPSEEVLVYIYYSKNCVNNGCGVSRYWNSSKQHENPWIDLKYGKDNVIAWQPLSAPYQPKGE